VAGAQVSLGIEEVEWHLLLRKKGEVVWRALTQSTCDLKSVHKDGLSPFQRGLKTVEDLWP
jgi:hypothetical protein